MSKTWYTRDEGNSYFINSIKPCTPPKQLYSLGMDRWGDTFISTVKRKEESLCHFTCGPTMELLNEVETFWKNEPMYKKMGIAYKRSILMYGPPGCGKSSAISRLIDEAILKHDALVFLQSNFARFHHLMNTVRSVEPTKKVLVLIEDIDKRLYEDEEEVLELFDGNTSQTNILYVSTTNFIKRLPNRFVNRPSRVDKRIEFPHLSAKQMAEYMSFLNVDKKLAKQLSTKLKKVTIAQIKEAVILAAVHKLPVDEVANMINEHVKTNEDDEDE